ncbi:MAG: hypothetical protein KC643_22505 [Nitrospira sp.]|nr:hypothetical protein [Nitrospira sp.]
MDDIILRCARRHLKDEKNIKYVEKEIVKRTHGFDYPNFRQMLVKLLGLINVEKIEKKVKRKLPVSLEDLLGPLKKARDSEAHTHINKGVTRHINAPSVTFGQFPGIYKGLVEFDSVIIKTKF